MSVAANMKALITSRIREVKTCELQLAPWVRPTSCFTLAHCSHRMQRTDEPGFDFLAELLAGITIELSKQQIEVQDLASSLFSLCLFVPSST